MKQKSFMILACFWLGSLTSSAQEEYSPSEDYWEYVNSQSEYYNALYVENNGEMKGTGYKPFMRWTGYWTELVHNDGTFSNTIDSRNQSISELSQSSNCANNLWTEIGPVDRPGGASSSFGKRIRGAGRLVFLEFDDVNNRVFTGSSVGGLYYSEDDGQTWVNGGTDYLPEVGVSHMQLAKNTNNGHTWFIATGDGEGAFNPSNGIWRTTDKGQTWHNIAQNNQLGIGGFPNFSWARCRKILIDPTNENVLYAAFHHGVYKTTNALATNPSQVTWTQILASAPSTNGGGFLDIQFQPGSNQNTIVVGGTMLNVSYDAGATWTVLANHTLLQKPQHLTDAKLTIRFAESDPDILYGGYTGKIFRMDITTSTVLVKDVVRFGQLLFERPQALAVSPTDEDEILFGNVRALEKSTDGMSTYGSLQQEHHDDIHWIEYRGTTEYWIATDGGIYKTLDGGQTWTSLSTGLGVAFYFSMSSSEQYSDYLIGGGWDTGPNLYTDATGIFTWTNVFGDAFESVITANNPTSPVHWVSGTNMNFARITPGQGISYMMNKLDNAGIGQRDWWQSFVMTGGDHDILYYAGSDRIGRTMDNGANWEAISFDPTNNGQYPNRLLFRVWNNSDVANVLYAQQVNFQGGDPSAFALMRSLNANAATASTVSWTDITPSVSSYNNGQPIRKTISMVAVDDEDPTKIWAVLPGYTPGSPKVLLYEGGVWSDITGAGINTTSVHSIDHQHGSDDIIYIGTTSGVYYKRDHETQWNLMCGVPHVRVSDIEVNHCESKVRVATQGRGIWEADLPVATNLSSTVDLMLKDTPEDNGSTPSIGVYTDAGPDIWVRNTSDGYENFKSENLVYNGTSFFVYVRVRNNSCTPSEARNLNLHWSRLGTAFSWDAEWNGSTPNGDLIGTEVIPSIPAGGSAIVEFEWDMTGHVTSFPNTNISTCLLAEIQGIPGDDIVSPAGQTLYERVKNNNNITMKNLVIRNAQYMKRGESPAVFVGDADVFTPNGAYDIVVSLPAAYSGSNTFAHAEVLVEFDSDLWNSWEASGFLGSGFEIFNEGDKLVRVLEGGAVFENIMFPDGTRSQITPSVNFLIEEANEDPETYCFVIQEEVHSNSEQSVVTGAVHYQIFKPYRSTWQADAGEDVSIQEGQFTILRAGEINEAAVYNWYDQNGTLVESATECQVSPSQTTTYALEVIADEDGFKDYDEVQVTVTEPNSIVSLTPNPASAEVLVTYTLDEESEEAMLILVNSITSETFEFTVETSETELTINLSGIDPGVYEVMLQRNGIIVDSETLSVVE